MEPIPAVTVDQVPQPLPAGLTVLDVREPVEWQQAHVPGSVHIPLGELPARLAELPSDDQLLVVCAVGARSARAVRYLLEHGRGAVNLAGARRVRLEPARELAPATG